MYYPSELRHYEGKFNKISFAVYCAAALIYMLRKQRDAVGITLFSDSIEFHSSAKSSAVNHRNLFAELEKLLLHLNDSMHRKSHVAETIHYLADNIHKRSLVVVFSDMFDNSEISDELLSSLQHLKHNKHEVILFHIADKDKEVDFNFENRPYKFIDMETNEEIKLHPNQVKEQYSKAVKEYHKQIKLKCGQYHIDFVEADINSGFNNILLSYLLRREKMM
jgi:uncharacterized protein (DUF58 family)